METCGSAQTDSHVVFLSFRFVTKTDLLSRRFPKDAKLRRQWLEVAQRDEGSLRQNSFLCSKHFELSCFTPDTEGQLSLSPDAVPTIMTVVMEEQVSQCSTGIIVQSYQLL